MELCDAKGCAQNGLRRKTLLQSVQQRLQAELWAKLGKAL